MESDWGIGERSISSINSEHQGNYSCSYAFEARPFVMSAQSEPLEFVISGTIYS